MPCYDEAERLPVSAFLDFLETHELRLVFVDDGSRDETLRVLSAMKDRSSRVDVLPLAQNSGKGEAVRLGMLHALDAGASIVGFIDADLATPLEELWRLLEVLRDPKIAVVTAARVGLHGWTIERKVMRHYIGRVFATGAALILRRRYYDTQCGAKLFRKNAQLAAALEAPFASRWIFDVELLGRLIHGNRTVAGLGCDAIVEHPVQGWRDVRGSKLGMRAMMRTPLELLKTANALTRYRTSGTSSARSEQARDVER